MTALSLPIEFSFTSPTPEGVARRGVDGVLMKRALAWSLVGHVALVVACIVAPWLLSSEPIGAPLSIDVEFVELSAHETILPQRTQAQQPEVKNAPVAPPRPKEAREEPVKVEKVQLSRAVAPPKPRRQEEASPSTPQPQLSADQSPTGLQGSTPGVVGGELVQKARVSYQDMVATRLARAKRYPDRAVRNRITGSGVLRLQIAAEGSVVSVEVVSSTQSPILDDELHRMVERAGPFPAFPADMGMSKIALVVPVSFRLES